MDLSSINKSNQLNKENVSFQGQKTVNSNNGKPVMRITVPYIELENNEELGLEIIKLTDNSDVAKAENKQYDWIVTGSPKRVSTDEEFKRGNKTYIDLDLAKNRLKSCDEFGYRFIVYDKNDPSVVKKSYTDSIGTKLSHNDNNYSIASVKQGTPRVGGAMEHIFTDSYNVLDTLKEKSKAKTPEGRQAEAARFKRTHVNKAGGTIQGIIEKLDSELSSNRYIMTTPLIGGGKVSSHMYHPANHFKVSEGTGDRSDFLELQTACFDNGKGYVLDGAFTSQGYEGLQFSHVLKRDDSPFKYWFKNPSGPIALGVLSDINEVNKKYAGIRIVNPKGVEGYEYDPNMPTYVQLYDTRLTSKEQLQDYGQLIDSYDIKNTEDPYEITTWHDAIACNYFEVDPSAEGIKGKTFGSMTKWEESGDLNSVLDPKGRLFTLKQRGSSGGTTGWDGNIDLVKMNLSNQVSSDPKMVEGSNQARNHMYNVARYWTEETRNALIQHIAEEIHTRKVEGGFGDDKASKESLEYFDDIENKYALEKGSLAKIYERILKEKNSKLYESQKFEKSYEYKIADDTREGVEFIQEEILNFPLESLSFSPELLAVLSTPYITPRPSATGNPAASKLEVFKDAQNNTQTKLSPAAERIYTEHLPKLVKSLLYTIQNEEIEDKNDKNPYNSKRLFVTNGDNIGTITPYGKYFVELAINDMMNFFITEALFDEDSYPTYENGSLNYAAADKKLGTKGAGQRLTLNKLNVRESSSEDEANAVAKKLEKGLKRLTKAIEDSDSEEFKEFKKYLVEKYYSIDTEDYKMAEAIVSQTGAGLNWRFDAAKDVADWEEVKTGTANSAQKAWEDVIGFWKPFVQTVKSINPSTYTIAEVTSLHDFNNYNWGIYGNADKAERIFYTETGATTGSNYSTYFGAYPKLFGKNIEEGKIENFRSISAFLEATQKFIQPDNNGHVSPEFILGSHVFLDNHDKPRAAHLMALDAELFWSSFNNGDEQKVQDYKNRAEKVLGRKYNDNMNSKAVAVAEQYNKYFEEACDYFDIEKSQLNIIKKSISHLANGYKYGDATDKTPNFKKADSFGQTPFEITLPHVIEQAETMGLVLDDSEKKNLINMVFKKMVEPYESKMAAIYELMLGTVGVSTLFAGDEFAQTGSETKSKNWALGCRNPIMHNWLTDGDKEHVMQFNNRIRQAGALSKKPGMSALADGTPIIVHVPKADPVKSASKEGLIKALEAVGHNNFGDIVGDGSGNGSCSFLKAAQKANPDFNEVMSELKSMDEAELKTKLDIQLKKVHPGMADWVRTNIGKFASANTETGAIYKYNDKGDAVLTVITNAFIPKDPEKVGKLLPSSSREIEKPKVSDLVLKDNQGKLVAKPGTIFIEKVYREDVQDYVDGGKYKLTKDGKLISEDGREKTINSTTTYFYKQRPFYTTFVKPIG